MSPLLTGLGAPLLMVGVSLVLGGLRWWIVKGDRRRALRTDVAVTIAIACIAGLLEIQMGRPVTYERGPVRLWAGDVNSDENSQQIADPYTFTHVVHGAGFYAITYLAAPMSSVALRAIATVTLEAAWEVYENTESVINRYRTATIALGYYGDSVLNSQADIVACMVGFLLAWQLPVLATVGWVLVLEVMLAVWIRDNLALNIIMLLHPFDAIKQWQASA